MKAMPRPVGGHRFRLDQRPLFRVQIFHIAEQEAVLLIVMCQNISDR